MNRKQGPKLSDPIKVRITDYLHELARLAPHHDALVFEGQRLSFRELESRVVTFARALLALGIRKGDRIAVLSTPRPEYWVSFLAASGVGAVWLGLSPKYTLKECRYVIDDAQPRLLFAVAEFEDRDYRSIVDALLAEHRGIEQAISLTGTIPGARSYANFLSFADEVSTREYRAAAHAVDRLDPALLVYTSGSSGQPKGALLSHYGLCYGATVQNHHFSVMQPSTLCCFPINHVACVADTCCVALVNGGTLHLHERFDPQQVLECIDRQSITYWLAVPTMLLMVLDQPSVEHTDFSNLELIIWGGAALPEPTIRRLQRLVPRLMNVYGLTETSANVTYTGSDASMEQMRDTIGSPSPAMPCRIVDVQGRPCRPNEPGELQFKGEYLFIGYINRPEETRGAFTADGWLRTGDVGYWREDGNITLVGRLSDMFKSGGYNVYPREIELLLESHPAVEMAAVVSVPDALYQEVGAAYVIPKHVSSAHEEISPAELRSFCKRHLANYKVPKKYTVLSQLPMLPVGKIDKVELKKRAAAQIADDRTSRSTDII